jgi:hypothetical protein
MIKYKQKLECGTHIHLYDPDRFPLLKDFSDEISDDINKFSLSML